MSDTVDVVACPACGAHATLRFCGHCGALVRPRQAPAGDVADDPEEVADEPATDGDREAPTAAPPETVPRHRWAVVAVLVVAVVAAAGQLRPPPPETVTLPGGGTAGAGGTGVTSDRAVTDLTRRWDAPGRGGDIHQGGGGWVEPIETSSHVLLQLDDALLAFDPVTGEPAWRLPWVHAVPGADSDAMLVFTPGELVQVEPDTGRVLHRTRLDEAAAGDQLAVTVGDNLAVAQAPVSGFDRRTGELRWRHEGTWLHTASGDVGVVGKGRNRVIDLRDGTTLWEVPGTPDGWERLGVVRDMLVVLDGRLTAYDLRSGAVRWRVDQPTGDAQPSHFAVHGDQLLVAAVDQPAGDRSAGGAWHGFHLDGRPFDVPAALPATLPHALTADGTWIHWSDDSDGGVVARRGDRVLWRRQLQANLIVAIGPYAAVATNDATVLLDAATGEEVDRFTAPAGWWMAPSHTVLEDCIVSTALREVAVRIADGEPCYEPGRARRLHPHNVFAGDGVSVVQTTVLLQGVGGDGEERWSHPVSGRTVVGLTPRWIALVDDQLRPAADGRPGDEVEVSLLDTRTGETAAALTLDALPWDWTGRGDVALVRLYDERTQEPRLELWALPTDDRPEPERRWALPHPSGAPMVLEDDAAIAVGSTMLVEHDLADGSVRRRVPLAVRVVGTPALHRDVAVGTADRDRLMGLDRRDGSLRWELALAGEVLGGPTIAGDVAYVTVAPREVVLVDVGSGAVRGTLQVDADLTGPALAAAGRLLVPTTAGVVAFGPELSVSSPAGRQAR